MCWDISVSSLNKWQLMAAWVMRPQHDWMQLGQSDTQWPESSVTGRSLTVLNQRSSDGHPAGCTLCSWMLASNERNGTLPWYHGDKDASLDKWYHLLWTCLQWWHRQWYGIASIINKTREAWLQLYGHVLHGNDNTLEQKGLQLEVDGKRLKSKLKHCWTDTLNGDMKITHLHPNQACDQQKWWLQFKITDLAIQDKHWRSFNTGLLLSYVLVHFI